MKTYKKVFSFAVGVLTIVWSMGLSQLANALSVTNMTVSTTSAEITFDGPVQMLPGSLTGSIELGASTTAANDLRNHVFKTGNPLATRNLSRFDPYSMTTQDLITAQNKMRIYGLKSLKLQEGDAFQWQIPASTIRHSTETSTFVSVSNTTSTVAASTDPIINNITNSTNGDTCNGWPCGNVSDTITIAGSNFPTSTSNISLTWSWSGGSATSTPATASATSLTAAIPSGASGQTNVVVTNLTNSYLSDAREIAVWNASTQAVIVGSVTSTTATDVNDTAVRAFQSGQMGNMLSTKTHNNGKYAMTSGSAATYNVEFITPAGTTKAAPSKVSSQSTTIGSKTTVAEQSFATAVLSGTVKGPVVDGEPIMEGVEVVAHNMDWTVAQRAKTGPNGVWKVYVSNSSSNQCYDIEAEPKDYHQQKLGYKGNKISQCLSQDGTASGLTINLTKVNVSGVIKTPTGTASTSNPYPDTAVPNANIGLHTSSWSYSQWTQSDSSGAFSFGSASGGTDYVLEIEPPMSGNFAGYARTMLTGLTVNASGTTNFGTKRFSLPNVWGLASCGGSAVANAWVELNKEGSWYGANTDSSGYFKFGGVTAGTYTLRIQPPSSSSCVSTSQSVPITTTEALEGKNLGTIPLSSPNVVVTVKDPTGTTGQQNIWVNFCPYGNPGTCYSGGTNSSGQVSFNVPNGSWRLEANPNWGSTYAPPQEIVVVVSGSTVTESVDQSNALTISSGNQLTVKLLDPSVAGLKGRVCKPKESGTDAEWAAKCADLNQLVGVSNVGVNLRVQGSMTGNQWTQSTSDGTYAFGSVDTGSYEIEAQPYSGCGATACSRKVITATITSSSSTRSGKNIVLASPNITGTVYKSASDLTAVPNAWINLETEGVMSGPGGFYGTSTNSSGEFSFGGIAAGTYKLKIEPPSWGSEAANYRQYSTRQYTGITISAAVAAGTESLNLGNRYLGVPQVVGRVLDGDSNAVAWSYMMVHNSDWSNMGGGSTDDSGYFRIGGLSSNSTGLSIEINMPWGTSQAWTQPSSLKVNIVNDVGTVYRDLDSDGVVDAGEALTNNLITLVAPAKTLSGTVTKEGTVDVVANATVEANRQMGGGHFETLTASNGTYSLKLSGGNWWVSVRPRWDINQPDWVYNKPQLTVTFAENDNTELQTKNFEVQVANATITGLVKDPTGQTAMANAWVMANSGGMMGPGNGSNTDSNGRFTFKVPAGVYELIANPAWSTQGDSYAASTPTKVKAIANQTTDAGTLTFKAKNSSIKGTVTDSAGNPISNVMVNAWQMNSAGWANTMSAANTGRYELKVSEGTWGVMVMPMSTSYVYQGGPQQVTVTSSQTSDNNDFLLKVADCKLKVSVKDASGNRVTNIWGGVSVRDTSLNDFMDFGDPKMMEGGSAASGGGAMGTGMEKGGFAGGGLMNGYTEINVPAGTYDLGLHSPPGSQYTLSATERATVSSSTTCGTTTNCKEVDLTVVENNATISGKAYIDVDGDGSYTSGTDTVVTGIRLFVNGRKSGGGWSMTEFAPSTSSDTYSLRVAPGTWEIDAFIDSMMAFGLNKYKVVSDDLTVTTTASSTTTHNIALKKLDKTISGTVKDPDDTAISNVWVFVDYGDTATANQMNDRGGMGVGTFTDSNGNYTLYVTSGTFKVGAGIPPWDSRDLINPPLQTVTIGDSNQTGINFQFTESDATITGDVTLSGAKNKAMIQAWSSNAGTGTFTESGTYTLKVKSGETWYVKATANISDTLYESTAEQVAVSAGANTKNLALTSTSITVPEAKTTTFSASSDKTIELSNGLKLEIPSGALATSGTVTVTVTPTVDVESTTIKADSKDKAIGLSYDFVAKNSSGQEITSFNQDVSITFPYNESSVTAAGYTETDIMPKYYDETTGTWEKYNNTTQDSSANTVTVTTDHFSAGGVTGGGISGSGGSGTPPPSGGGSGSGLAKPYNLSLIINNGATQTVSKTVDLAISIANARWMMIANDKDFKDLFWEDYRVSKAWTLTDGLGEKTIYIKFKSGQGVESDIFSAKIKLVDKITEIISKIISPKEAKAQEIKLLTYNSKSKEVVELQDLLKQLGYLAKNISSTGWFGPLTKKAVLTLQKAKSLALTGAIDLETVKSFIEKVVEEKPAVGVYQFKINLRYSNKSEEIKKLQIKLKELGHFPADIDATGFFGSITLKAVKAYQAVKNLPTTGFVGPMTRGELNK